MTDAAQWLTYSPLRTGGEVAILGVHPVAMRRPAPQGGDEWCSLLPSCEPGRVHRYWRRAADDKQSRHAIGHHVAQWYDALHMPTDDATAARIAAQLAGAR